MTLYDYNATPRHSIEYLTESDSVIDQDITTTIITAYNHSVVMNYYLGASTIDGFTKFIKLSDQSGIAQVNMYKGSFILDYNYPTINLSWDNGTMQWLPIGDSPPFFITRQQGTKLVGTGFAGDSQQGIRHCMSADGNTLAFTGYTDDSEANNIGATWVFTRNGTVWTQQGLRLVGTGFSLASSFFINQGTSVDISKDGNTLAVGAWRDSQANQNSVGATWVFTRTGTVWTQQGLKLVGTGFSGASSQGASVALSADSNTLVVGGNFDTGGGTSAGASWVFTRTGTVWTQQGGKLIGTGLVGNPQQGSTIEISADGNTFVVGGPKDDGVSAKVGGMWVFTRSNGVWTQQGLKLVGTGFTTIALNEGCNQGLGMAMAADGNMFVTGGFADDSFGINNLGAVWTFIRNGTVWTQSGEKLIGTGFSSSDSLVLFGSAVSLSGDGKTLIVCAQGDDSPTVTDIGATWTFTRSKDNTTWIQRGVKLIGTGFSGTGGDGDINQRSQGGKSLSSLGNTLVVGSPKDDGAGPRAGAVWVFI